MSVLLPNSHKEFADPQYWQKFFAECKTSSFEWYGDYLQLSKVLDKYIKPTDAILQIGCGNSALAEQMYDNGFRNITNIDTDAKVIDRLKLKHAETRPSLVFECRSAANNCLPNASINAILDKGTLDALLPPNFSEKDAELVTQIFNEIDRCLAPFGRYIVFSLCQSHIVKFLLDYFWPTRRFLLRILKCEIPDSDFAMPVFALVIAKFKMPLPKSPAMEFARSTSSSFQKIDEPEQLQNYIESQQEINWFNHFVHTNIIDEASVTISGSDAQPRYEITIVDDLSRKKLLTWGIFIVPIGREGDWLFSTLKGRNVLRNECKLHRLVLVRLFRNQQYASMQDIQHELDSIVPGFKPKTCPKQNSAEYLSLGSADVREVIEQGESPISGKWAVEHVQIHGKIYRRLTFLGASNLVQSDVEVTKDDSDKWVIASNASLACEHHRAMLTAIEFIALEKSDQNDSRSPLVRALDTKLRFAVLGLGGGTIAKFLHDKFAKAEVIAVELDKVVAEIAVKHFEYPAHDPRMCIIVEDALVFLKETAEKDESEKFDVIFVDISGSSHDEGLYCPPSPFVTEESLRLMHRSLTRRGVLALNLVTRDSDVSNRVKKAIQHVFSLVFQIAGDEDINEVIICPLVKVNICQPQIGPKSGGGSKKFNKKSQQRNQNGTTGTGKEFNKVEDDGWIKDYDSELRKLQNIRSLT